MKNKKIISLAGLLLTLLRFGALPAQAAGPGDLLVPVGELVGIDLLCRGALVSGYAEIATETGERCPAREAGVRPGDRITALDGTAVTDGEDFIRKAAAFNGSPVALTVSRDGRELALTVTPVRGDGDRWQLGLWLRDAVHGVGTVTFYDPAAGTYGALGHGVSAPESRELLPVAGGGVTESAVTRVVPGQAGAPGELCGDPGEGGMLGTVESNTASGIFGAWAGPVTDRAAVPAAADGEIRPGPASILTTVDGAGPRLFTIQITRVDAGGQTGRMAISVTDPELLALTGGIVQGMSGSPILQNGKLVGAVTHVLVSDPSKGYGVTIENMLSAADRVAAAA